MRAREHLGVDDATRDLWRLTLELLEKRGEGSLALASTYLLPVAGDVSIVTTPQWPAFIIPRMRRRSGRSSRS